jgi:hypothetical protein
MGSFRLTYDLFVRYNYIFGLFLIIVSLPFSKFLLSVGQFWVLGCWALERIDQQRFLRYFTAPVTLRKKVFAFPFLLRLFFKSILQGFKALRNNKAAWIIMSFYVLHAIGLIYTSDFGYAFKDLRTKAPMFILPLFIAASEGFGRKGFYRFLILMILTLLCVTLVNTWNLAHGEYVDLRDVSRFSSHIMLGLMIAMGLFVAGFFLFRKTFLPLYLRLLLIPVALWFFAYLVLTKSLTGLAVFCAVLIIFCIVLMFQSRNKWMKAGMTLLILAAVVSLSVYLRNIVRDYYRVNPIDLTKLDTITPNGNRYFHNPSNGILENGNFVWIYVQWDELRQEWAKRSNLNFDSLDQKQQPVSYTLIRFLASKGLRKDAAGVRSLSDDEVTAIEKGMANVIYMKEFSMRGRIYELLMGYEKYRKTGDPTGSTLMQRLEFWKASAGIIKDNWIAGVGTGDMNIVFRDQYEKMNTKLAPDQRWRSHNQYLSVMVGFGIFGLAWFLASILLPPWILQRFHDYFFLIFLLIMLISMITGDTIESQVGVTLFYFWYSFLLFGRKETDPIQIQDT